MATDPINKVHLTPAPPDPSNREELKKLIRSGRVSSSVRQL